MVDNTKIEWKDISSFSQGEKDKTPKTFETYVVSFRIVVTRHIGFKPDEWILRCEPMFKYYIIGIGSAEEAQGAAIVAVREQLSKVCDMLKEAEEWITKH